MSEALETKKQNKDERTVLYHLEEASCHFTVDGHKKLKAVDQVTLDIFQGETLGLVGESGCGKTTLGRLLARVYPLAHGDITFKGKSLTGMNQREGFDYCKQVQMIFQDPYASLNPRMTVGSIIGEGLEIHKVCTHDEWQARVYDLLEMVGLNREQASRFPHEFSGGQRQRIGIARSLAIEPEFIVCDEPISALDVSIQAQILNLLTRLKKKFDLTYLFISHDLNVVKYIADRVAVMYLGILAELASNEQTYRNPLHPYTQALLSAIPVPDPEVERRRQRIVLTGDVPSPINAPIGCTFSTRCPYVMKRCMIERPVLQGHNEHTVACHLYDTGARSIAEAVAMRPTNDDIDKTELQN
jgi:oligopeptide transport system ATP-binding protein